MILDLFSPSQVLNLAATDVRTVSGNDAGVDVRGLKGIGIVTLDIAAGTGTTPTCSVNIQDSPDGSTGWSNIVGATFVLATTAARFEALPLDIDSIRGWIRARWVITGTTPSYYFSVNGIFRRM